MALEDGSTKLDDNQIHTTKGENSKAGLGNGGMGDSRVMKELLAKQQEKTKELEERLYRLTVEWNAERSELHQQLMEAKEAQEKNIVEAEGRHAKVEDEKRHLSEQYKNLVDKVAALKDRMGEKLKADAVSPYRSRGHTLSQSTLLKGRYTECISEGTEYSF